MKTDGEKKIETVADLIFLDSKITAHSDWSYEIKRRLFLGRKNMTNIDRILKSRDITLPLKVCIVKAMVFPVVMHGCESWTLKKAECWRIYTFELWRWKILLRVPCTARRSNQSIPIGNRLTIYWKDWRQEETGMIQDEMVGWHHWLNRHEFGQTPGDSEGQGRLLCYTPWGHKE